MGEIKIKCFQLVIQNLFQNKFLGLCRRLGELLNYERHDFLLI